MNGLLARAIAILLTTSLFPHSPSVAGTADRVRVDGGIVEGVMNPATGVRSFKGVPYAAPPVGDLRWRAPQPVVPWVGVRLADAFGPRCPQQRVYDDMVFRDSMSEDCLFLNVWVPPHRAGRKLPVMVWIHGGGFIAGSTSEPRQDGEHLAEKGVIVVSMNYRLGIFGFFSHPELTKESGHNSSGNYGLLDQVAALQWVQRNIERFGGDPNKVTIFGESAGSLSVCALCASPLAKGLFRSAIGESGAYFGRPPLPLAQSEAIGDSIASTFGAGSIESMRQKSADEIVAGTPRDWWRISTNIDGYFLPERPESSYVHGRQNRVPLLAGWNADEGKMTVVFQPKRPTIKNFTEQAKATFGKDSDLFLSLYQARTDSEAVRSAMDYEGDKFMGFATWKWIETHSKTGSSVVYRYSFDQTPLAGPGANYGGIPSREFGARHAGEIEYVFGTFPLTGIPWQPGDKTLSDLIRTYWTNFAKTRNPNGTGLPVWPACTPADGFPVMHLIGDHSHAEEETRRARYQFLDIHREWWKEQNLKN